MTESAPAGDTVPRRPIADWAYGRRKAEIEAEMVARAEEAAEADNLELRRDFAAQGAALRARAEAAEATLACIRKLRRASLGEEDVDPLSFDFFQELDDILLGGRPMEREAGRD